MTNSLWRWFRIRQRIKNMFHLGKRRVYQIKFARRRAWSSSGANPRCQCHIYEFLLSGVPTVIQEDILKWQTCLMSDGENFHYDYDLRKHLRSFLKTFHQYNLPRKKSFQQHTHSWANYHLFIWLTKLRHHSILCCSCSGEPFQQRTCRRTVQRLKRLNSLNFTLLHCKGRKYQVRCILSLQSLLMWARFMNLKYWRRNWAGRCRLADLLFPEECHLQSSQLLR